MSKKAKLFFRNDDVRATLDESLIQLTKLFIKHNIPVSHAVEPANVSKEVVEWLLKIKKENPNLIEIIQHGFNHKLNYQKVIGGKLRKGEFGGDRSYEQELNTLSRGKDLMNNYFGEHWLPVITFPYGAYNGNTIKAVSDLGYLGLSSSVSYAFKSFIKDKIGRLLKKDLLFSKRVSYHNSFRNNTNIFELDISVNFIKKYIDENQATHFSSGELFDKLMTSMDNTHVIGVLLHHRYHSNKLNELEKFLTLLKDKDYTFSTLKKIIDEKKQ